MKIQIIYKETENQIINNKNKQSKLILIAWHKTNLTSLSTLTSLAISLAAT